MELSMYVDSSQYIFVHTKGYVQGMSDLLSPILFVMDDEADAFWCFVGFMEMVVGSNGSYRTYGRTTVRNCLRKFTFKIGRQFRDESSGYTQTTGQSENTSAICFPKTISPFWYEYRDKYFH